MKDHEVNAFETDTTSHQYLLQRRRVSECECGTYANRSHCPKRAGLLISDQGDLWLGIELPKPRLPTRIKQHDRLAN
jgi:hypothetical protein